MKVCVCLFGEGIYDSRMHPALALSPLRGEELHVFLHQIQSMIIHCFFTKRFCSLKLSICTMIGKAGFGSQTMPLDEEMCVLVSQANMLQ